MLRTTAEVFVISGSSHGHKMGIEKLQGIGWTDKVYLGKTVFTVSVMRVFVETVTGISEPR